jgi:MFS superfamily sulfate permease-like transporter
VILEATGIIEIDFTAAQTLRDLIRTCHADGIDFAIARLESLRAQQALARFGITELLGPNRQFHSVEQAVESLGNTETAVKRPSFDRPRPGPNPKSTADPPLHRSH